MCTVEQCSLVYCNVNVMSDSHPKQGNFCKDFFSHFRMQIAIIIKYSYTLNSTTHGEGSSSNLILVLNAPYSCWHVMYRYILIWKFLHTWPANWMTSYSHDWRNNSLSKKKRVWNYKTLRTKHMIVIKQWHARDSMSSQQCYLQSYIQAGWSVGWASWDQAPDCPKPLCNAITIMCIFPVVIKSNWMAKIIQQIQNRVRQKRNFTKKPTKWLIRSR